MGLNGRKTHVKLVGGPAEVCVVLLDKEPSDLVGGGAVVRVSVGRGGLGGSDRGRMLRGSFVCVLVVEGAVGSHDGKMGNVTSSSSEEAGAPK